MVNSPWKGQCSSCPQAEKQIRPHHFERCQWQSNDGPNVWYLLYRWFLAMTFLTICLYSIINYRRWEGDDLNNSWKWFIFLTNWGFLACTLQSVLALMIVQSTWIKKSKVKDETRQLSKVHHIYWALHNLAVDMALVVSLVYWSLVYEPKTHPLDAINCLTHAGNSIMMLIDMFMVMHPCRLIHILNPVVLAIVYFIASYIYYVCGGTDRHGRPYIYPSLNWNKPGKAVCFFLLCLTVLAVIHCVSYCLYRLRHRLAQRLNPTTTIILAPQEKPMLVEMA